VGVSPGLGGKGAEWCSFRPTNQTYFAGCRVYGNSEVPLGSISAMLTVLEVEATANLSRMRLGVDVPAQERAEA